MKKDQNPILHLVHVSMVLLKLESSNTSDGITENVKFSIMLKWSLLKLKYLFDQKH